jgi:ectoine hydroxylase-related dioxygenase (phytanoyl-CoA dioxygenase family)
MRLAPEQVATYEEKGYLTVPNFFTLEQIRIPTEYMVAHEHITWKDKNDDPMREPHYKHPEIFEVATLPKLLDAVGSILGPDIVLLYIHILNKKAGGGRRVAWHQDGPYWPRVEPKVAVTAWIALDDADAGNGCMRVIPGTHKGCVDFGQKLTNKPDLIQDHAIELPDGVVDESKAEDIVMKRGDLSLHHSYIIHGSEPNNSDRRRAAMTVRYVPAATKIQPRPDRRQYLVRGKAVDNGNEYFAIGK